jgi:DNA-binding transcriptional MocR family regulator
LLLQSEVRREQRVADASVRSLARSLGVTKDTVARAIRRLRAAGIVTADQTRSAEGQFNAATYRIVPPVGVTVTEMADSRHRRPAQNRPATRELQLALTLDS